MLRRLAVLTLPALLLFACAGPGAPPPVQPLRVVFFEDDCVGLGGPATAVVAGAAWDASANPSLPVHVIGYVAPEAGQAPTVAPARARAERVANELARLGVARDRVQVQGRGPVTFDLAPVESRRVEIRIGGA